MPAGKDKADGNVHAIGSNMQNEGTGTAEGAQPSSAVDADRSIDVQELLQNLLSPVKRKPQEDNRSSTAGESTPLKSAPNDAGPSAGPPLSAEQDQEQQQPPPMQRSKVKQIGQGQRVLHVPRPAPKAFSPKFAISDSLPPPPDPAAARAAWGHQPLPPGLNFKYYTAYPPLPYGTFPTGAQGACVLLVHHLLLHAR